MRNSPRLSVAAISFVSFIAVLCVTPSVQTWENISVDGMLRLRYILKHNQGKELCRDIAVIGIDSKTQDYYGRWGSGQWISRKPFSDLLDVMTSYYKPRVLAYDVIFQDALGRQSKNTASVTESPEQLQSLISQLNSVSSNTSQVLSYAALDKLNVFILEQGNMRLMNKFAAIGEDGQFSVICGYSFKEAAVGAGSEKYSGRAWSVADITGSEASADENKGARIPYILDMSIPVEDVSGYDIATSRIIPASNALLPSIELVDYCLLGFLNGAPDPDGVVRRIPMIMPYSYGNPVTGEVKTRFAPSVSLASCLIHLGVGFPLKQGIVKVRWGERIDIYRNGKLLRSVPIDDSGCLYLDYTRHLDDFRPLSFSGLITKTIQAARSGDKSAVSLLGRQINGKICFVGITSTGVDIGACPLESRVPLVTAHLTAAENIINNRFVIPVKGAAYLFLLFSVFALFTGICMAEDTVRFAPTAFIFGCFYLVLAYFLLHFHMFVLPVIGPVLYMGTCSFSVMAFRLFKEIKAKRRIRNMFSTMVSDKVLAFLEQNPGRLSMKGYSTDATIFFSDIEGFTVIGERLTPDKLTGLLNDYLDPVSDCIIEHGGYLDKYMGDGIMAVWGVPFYDGEHAYKACASALRQIEIVRGMSNMLLEKYGTSVNVRMGINSGKVIAGNMGSSRKLQYTVIGDEVNLASRLEPTNKDYGTNIIISEATCRLVRDRFLVRRLGGVMVVGKTVMTDIYELVCDLADVTEERRKNVAVYEKALDLFVQRRWSETIAVLEGQLHDKPSAILLRRAHDYKLSPPSESWVGELVRLSKD